MKSFLTLLGAVYEFDDNTINELEDIAKKLGASIPWRKPNYVELSIPGLPTVELSISNVEKFESSLAEGAFLDGMGPLLLCMISQEDKRIFIPFLKEFLKLHPNLVLFNDEVEEGEPLVFTKAQIDAFPSNDVWDNLFQQPPVI